MTTPPKDLTRILDLPLTDAPEEADAFVVSEPAAPLSGDSFESVQDFSQPSSSEPDSLADPAAEFRIDPQAATFEPVESPSFEQVSAQVEAHLSLSPEEVPVASTASMEFSPPAAAAAPALAEAPAAGVRVHTTPKHLQAPEPTTAAQAPSSPKTAARHSGASQARVPEAAIAAYPYSLLIEGTLSDDEKQIFLDFISSENFGIRPLDLEPQLAAGRILLPRISEYACVRVIQKFRDANVVMRMGPSDTIFASSDAGSDTLFAIVPDSVRAAGGTAQVRVTGPENLEHPADRLPVTASDELPQFSVIQAIDQLMATTTLERVQVEQDRDGEIARAIEALKREMRYKAWRKGASGIVKFASTVEYLPVGANYRLSVAGTAVKNLG